MGNASIKIEEGQEGVPPLKQSSAKDPSIGQAQLDQPDYYNNALGSAKASTKVSERAVSAKNPSNTTESTTDRAQTDRTHSLLGSVNASAKYSEKATSSDSASEPSSEPLPVPDSAASAQVAVNRIAAQGRAAVTVPVEPEPDEPEAVEDFDILVQIIPYYGQGDPSNDILVRSTLMNLQDSDIEKVDEFGNTLLMLACQYRLQDLARILLNKGADANAKNHSGAYCLHFPCYKDTQSLPIAKMLLQAGANPEVAEASYGCTPLHYCASGGNVDFCKLLIQFGSFVGTRDFYNYTAVDYAREAGMTDAAKFLQKKLLALTNNAAPGLVARGVSQRGGFVYDNIRAEAPSCDQFREHDWTSSIDPASGGRYFINQRTGECLWEADFEFLKLQKMLASPQPAHKENGQNLSVKLVDPGLNTNVPASPATALQLARADSLRNFGRQGTASGNTTLSRSTSRYENPEAGGSGGGLDGATVQKLISEAQMQAKKILEDERALYRDELAEKDGQLAKLQCELEALTRAKASLETDVNSLKDNLSANMSDTDVLKSIQDNLQREKEEVAGLRFQLAASKTQFAENLSRAEHLAATARQQAREAEERAEEVQAMMKSLENEVCL